MLTLRKLMEMTYPDTHIVLYNGAQAINIKSEVLFDGKSQDVDLDTYGNYEIVYDAGAADQPCGVRLWLYKPKSK